MKKLSLFTTVLLLLFFTTKTPVATLTDSERKYATDLLLQTEAGVINAAAGTSEPAEFLNRH